MEQEPFTYSQALLLYIAVMQIIILSLLAKQSYDHQEKTEEDKSISEYEQDQNDKCNVLSHPESDEEGKSVRTSEESPDSGNDNSRPEHHDAHNENEGRCTIVPQIFRAAPSPTGNDHNIDSNKQDVRQKVIQNKENNIIRKSFSKCDEPPTAQFRTTLTTNRENFDAENEESPGNSRHSSSTLVTMSRQSIIPEISLPEKTMLGDSDENQEMETSRYDSGECSVAELILIIIVYADMTKTVYDSDAKKNKEYKERLVARRNQFFRKLLEITAMEYKMPGWKKKSTGTIFTDLFPPDVEDIMRYIKDRMIPSQPQRIHEVRAIPFVGHHLCEVCCRREAMEVCNRCGTRLCGEEECDEHRCREPMGKAFI